MTETVGWNFDGSTLISLVSGLTVVDSVILTVSDVVIIHTIVFRVTFHTGSSGRFSNTES
jgi:hypothetical protein